MTSEAIRVLLVDNQIDAIEVLAGELQVSYGYQVDTVNGGEAAIERVRETGGGYDVMLIDVRLGGGLDGIETMKAIQAEYPHIETIIITGYASKEDGIRAMKEGACTFALKPLSSDQAAAYISSADERRRLRQTARERDWLQDLLDLSQGMSSNLTLEQVAEHIYSHLRKIFPQVDSVYITIHDPDRKQFRSILAADGDVKRQFVCDDEFGLMSELKRTRQPRFIDDLLAGAENRDAQLQPRQTHEVLRVRAAHERGQIRGRALGAELRAAGVQRIS